MNLLEAVYLSSATMPHTYANMAFCISKDNTRSSKSRIDPVVRRMKGLGPRAINRIHLSETAIEGIARDLNTFE